MTESQAVTERLKTSNSPFPRLIYRASCEGNYILSSCELADIAEFAIHKRDGDYFIIVGFFNDPSKANKEATEILINHPKWIESINYKIEYHNRIF